MALHWRPVGPEPASTYWQRRAVVAAALVLPVVLLLSLTGGGSEAPDTLAEAPPSPVPTSAAPGPAPTPSASPTPAVTPICQPEALEVEALAGEDSYAVGASPRLSLRVTNTGAAPCTRDLGQAAVELLVFSGGDRIWSSDDCAPGGPEDVVTLAPGEPVTRASTWDGRRSLPGCKGSKAQALPGTYRVSARVGQLVEEGDVFVLRG